MAVHVDTLLSPAWPRLISALEAEVRKMKSFPTLPSLLSTCAATPRRELREPREPREPGWGCPATCHAHTGCLTTWQATTGCPATCHTPTG